MDVVKTIWAREQIRDLLSTYCHGIDRQDWVLVRSCFGDDYQYSHASFEGNLDDFISFVSGFQNDVAVSHHSITNAKIEISEDGTSAQCDSNFIAFHRIEDGKLERMSFPSNGQGTNWTVAGRYIDDCEFRDGKWVIVKRKGFNQWTQSIPI